MMLLHALMQPRPAGPVPAIARVSVPSVSYETGGHVSSVAAAAAVSDEPVGAIAGSNLAAWVVQDASGMGAVSLGEVKA
jgi:hypothetical protein